MDLAREPGFRLGGMDVRPSTREVVWADGREVVEPRVMSVLVRLARAGGEVVTRDDLTEACWDGRVVSDDAINRVISRIRRVSELTGGRDFTLETITKVGYRLVAAGGGEAAAVAAPVDAVAPVAAKPGPGLGVLVAGIAALVMAVAVGVWWFVGREPEWTADPRASLTLAVLPFDNLSASADDQPLALGMSREVRNTLSRVRGLRVVSDQSSFAIAAENLPADQIGKRLKADYLLDGSLTRSGDTVRLSAELVDGWTGVNLWTGTESGPASDLDQLRQMISSAVFVQLVARIGPERLEQLAPARRENPEAYRLLIEATELMSQVRDSRMRGQAAGALAAGDKADELIDRALAVDPDSPFALGMKGAIIAAAATSERYALNTPAAVRQANAAIYLRRALAVDPDNVQVLASLGEYSRRYEWRWDEARALLQRSLAIDPNNGSAHLSYSYYLSGVGRCVEALQHAEAAVAIDPEFGWQSLSVPRAQKCLGQFEASDAGYLAALETDPGNLFILREVYLNKLVRRDAEGLRELRRHVRDDVWKGKPTEDVERWLVWTGAAQEALEGQPARFVEMIEREAATLTGRGSITGINELQRGQSEIMWIHAIEFAFAGQPKRAVDLLARAVAGGALYIPETMPFGAYEFTPEVRADPRYQAIWRSDPRLIELVDMRRQSIEARQMDGVLPDGTKVRPT